MIMVFVCLAVSDCTLIARKHAITVASVAICAMKAVNKSRDNQSHNWTHAPHTKYPEKLFTNQYLHTRNTDMKISY